MRWARIIEALALVAALVAACSKSEAPASAPVNVEARTDTQESVPPSLPGTEPLPTLQPRTNVPVRFHLFTGSPGFKLPDSLRLLTPGTGAAVGLDGFDLEVLAPGESETVLRSALRVSGAEQVTPPEWISEGGLSLTFGSGKPGERISVSLALAGAEPYSLLLTRVAPAQVVVDQRYQDEWRPVTVLNAVASEGAGIVRLTFSKPVRQGEVEAALTAAQDGPVRGSIYWADEQTMIWQISSMPSRLDFLLGGAHDRDGLPLPGGIPSLRVGDPPRLVEVDLSSGSEAEIAVVPPDIIGAKLTGDGKYLNLTAWRPGTNRWDWSTVELYLSLRERSLKSGQVQETQPRLPDDLSDWFVNQQGTAVAGLKTEAGAGDPSAPRRTDLVIQDLRGGRRILVSGFISRFLDADRADLSSYLVWSADGLKVAALSYSGEIDKADLIAYGMDSGLRTTLLEGLPIPAFGTALAWSADAQHMLVGNLLVNLKEKRVVPLKGDGVEVNGAWEGDGKRLLYNTRDWGPVFLIDPERLSVLPLDEGRLVGWSGPGRALMIRWHASKTRYAPAGL